MIPKLAKMSKNIVSRNRADMKDLSTSKTMAIFNERYSELMKHNKSRFEGAEIYLKRFYCERSK
jgi:hypothetical protein